MSWVTLLWSMDGALCFTLAGIYLLVWFKQREKWEYLLFSCSALAAGLIAGFELTALRTETTAQYGAVLRWSHLPVWMLVLSMVWFVRLYLRAGRPWLVWSVCGLRTLVLVLNFLFTPNINYREITSLQHLSWWGGETVLVPLGVPNPWTLVSQLTSLLLLIFFVDATITVWRRGDRRRALVVGGSAIFSITLALGQSVLVIWGVIHWPLFPSFFYLFIIAAMGYELSEELLRAAQLSRQFQASEAALRENEQRLDLATRAANLGLWAWDVARNELWITEKGRSLFGFPQSEQVDIERFRSRIHPEDRESILQAQKESLESSGKYDSEYRIVRPDGEIRWIAGSGRAEFDGAGKAIFMRGASRDVTHRKLAEEALRESEARFRTVANTAPVMIWMSGTDKLCTFFNKGWLDFTGRTLEQELGNGWAGGVHHEDFNSCLEVYANSFDARESFTMEYRLRGSDGKYGWVLDTGTPRFASDGAFLGYIGSCIDITERKQAEQETLLLRQEIAHVGRVSMMGQLASALAHEINQPLAAILRNAEAAELFMQHPSPDLDEIRAIIADIRKDDQRAGSVIDRMRSLLKRQDLDTRPLEIGELVSEVAALVQADAAARHVKLEVRVPGDLQQVSGDRVHLQQVLLNLVINGMDALKGAAEKRVTVSARSDGAHVIEIAVSDTGPGIPAEQLEHIFDPFFSTKPTGMGMGLPISRTIIEAHGGRLWAENNESGGGTFRFTVKVARETSEQ
jgi:two-component system, LuxR family, sensor kinase FixL